MRELWEEIKEEFLDFVEDFDDLVNKRPSRQDLLQKAIVVGGQLTFTRPAYLFAERVENLLKLLFGISVVISAFTATFVGYASLSGLVEALIDTILGRVILCIVGVSYMILAIWKTLHLGQKTAS